MGIIRNIFNYMQLFNLVRRVNRNKENDLILFQYIIRFASSAAITIATAVYLWSYENDTVCRAARTPSSWTTEELVDVSRQFRDILKIWWTFALIDTARCLLVFSALGHKQIWFTYVYYALSFNDLLGVAAIIILHDYRFKYAGQYCSGDFLDIMGPQPGFLVQRGNFLIGLVIYIWIGILIHACVWGCVVTAAQRRKRGERNFKCI